MVRLLLGNEELRRQYLVAKLSPQGYRNRDYGWVDQTTHDRAIERLSGNQLRVLGGSTYHPATTPLVR